MVERITLIKKNKKGTTRTVRCDEDQHHLPVGLQNNEKYTRFMKYENVNDHNLEL